MSGFGYTAAIPSASGAPLENRMAYSTCGGDMRVAPDIGHARGIQFGGRRRKGRKGSRKQRKGSRKQRGGACGCNGAMPPAMLQRGGVATSPAQRGGGGGTGGYSTMLSNDLGKVHAGYMTAPCPSAPVPTQVGGGAAATPMPRSPLDLVSYPTGYGYSPSSVVSTSSAHYLDQQGYNKTCSGGYRKSRKSQRKSQRKGSRKSQRKGSRSAHRKH